MWCVPQVTLHRRSLLGTVALSVAGTGCLTRDEQGESPNADDSPTATESVDDATASDEPHHVTAGPGGDIAFEPARLEVDRGATVVWTWDSDNHTVTPTSVPEGAEWDGHPEIAEAGTTYEHTFDVEGFYEYQCDPHAAVDVVGEIVVGDPDEIRRFDGTIVAGPDRERAFDPARVEVEPGTTVRWEWDSDHHNVSPTSIPEDAEWKGHPEVADRGTEYEHTFEVPGTYEYECEPHAVAGMTGTIVVREE